MSDRKEIFTTEIGVSGNSLIIRITKQAERLGLSRGDLVCVTLERRE